MMGKVTYMEGPLQTGAAATGRGLAVEFLEQVDSDGINVACIQWGKELVREILLDKGDKECKEVIAGFLEEMLDITKYRNEGVA